MSTVEDVSSLVLSVLAILVPVLAALALIGGVVALGVGIRRYRRRRCADTVAASD